MPYSDNQGIRIHYQVAGEGPPLVLHHGFTQSVKHWYMAGYVNALQPNYQLILLDARGHGASDKPHDPTLYALPLQVSDTVAVLDDLHLSRAHFWGYSMGGRIGFGMAKYVPERVHALIIGGSHPYERPLPASSRLDGSDPKAFIDALFGRLSVDLTTLPPEIRDELFANDFRALAAAQQDWSSLEDILPTMTMPCLLYAGEADPYYPQIRECTQQMPHIAFFSLPNLDHGAAFREANLVLPQVTEFLQTRSEGATILEV